ncbi:hypothetical protein Emed_001514 [Eimeria media]
MPRDEAVALAAGASIGIIADVILFPLDFLKTRQQGKTSASTHGRSAVPREAAAAAAAASAAPSPRTPQSPPLTAPPHGVPEAPSQFKKPRGLSSCYKGIAALAMGSMPSSAGMDSSHGSTHIVSAAIAESSACVIRNPFEVVKQQVQLGLHPSTAIGFKSVWRHEGLRGFFVGMGTSMLRDVPFAALQLFLWEWMKLKFLGKKPPPTRSSAIVSGAAGMVAGAVAAVVTTPMDVVKTRLMTQEPGSRQYRGFYHCMHTMLRTEGVSSLFLGVKMRCLWVALGGGIFLGGYDALKHSVILRLACISPYAKWSR